MSKRRVVEVTLPFQFDAAAKTAVALGGLPALQKLADSGSIPVGIYECPFDTQDDEIGIRRHNAFKCPCSGRCRLWIRPATQGSRKRRGAADVMVAQRKPSDRVQFARADGGNWR